MEIDMTKLVYKEGVYKDLIEFIDSSISMYTSVLEASNNKTLEFAKEITVVNEDGTLKDNSEELFYLWSEQKAYEGYLAALYNIKAYITKTEDNAEAAN
jgi:hypothetical protein